MALRAGGVVSGKPVATLSSAMFFNEEGHLDDEDEEEE
jgi:hypothetical protein